MNREEWLEQRRTGIGGTDAAACLGVSKWKSPLDVYLDKRGEAPPVEDNDRMYWGRTLEPVVLAEYQRRVGIEVYQPAPMLRSQRYPWLYVNLDGQRVDGMPVEVKTASSADGWGEPGSADVPVDYVCQTTLQMIVTETRVVDIPVLIAGSDFRIYSVPFDAELAEMIIDATRDMWQRIQTGNAPEPRSAADLAKLYRISKSQPIEAPDAIYAAWMQLRAVRAEIAAAEQRAEELETAIKAHMRDCDTLIAGGSTLATWKTAKASQRLDAKLVQAEAPDVYAKCLVTGQPSRRFLIKEPKQ